MQSWIVRLYEDASQGRLGPRNHPVVRRVVEAVHIGVVLVRETIRDRLHVRAANLAFWTAVAIVPILLLAFALTVPLGLSHSTRGAVRDLLFRSVLSSSVEEVAQVLDQLLEGANLRTFGVVGVIGIMVIGSQLFFSAELAYNDIFRTPVRRSRILRFTLFYAGITLGPLLLGAGFVATARVGDLPGLSLFLRFLPVLLTAAVFVGAIRLLPCSPVGWKAALAGGFVSSLLFEAAKIGFAAYTAIFGAKNSLAQVYGSVAFLPVFLTWIYLSWLVVLFGVEIAYLVQHHRSLLDDQRRRAADPHAPRRQPDGFFGLAMVTAISEQYELGRGGPTLEDLAERTGTDPLHVQFALDVLEDAGLILRSVDGRLMPARPASQISAAEVVQRWRELAAPRLRGPGLGAVRLALSTLEASLNTPILRPRDPDRGGDPP